MLLVIEEFFTLLSNFFLGGWASHVTSNNAQGLFLVLHSGIFSGSALGILRDVRDRTQYSSVQESSIPATL